MTFRKPLRKQAVVLRRVARDTGGGKILSVVSPSSCQRDDVVERRCGFAAVHAPPIGSGHNLAPIRACVGASGAELARPARSLLRSSLIGMGFAPRPKISGTRPGGKSRPRGHAPLLARHTVAVRVPFNASAPTTRAKVGMIGAAPCPVVGVCLLGMGRSPRLRVGTHLLGIAPGVACLNAREAVPVFVSQGAPTCTAGLAENRGATLALTHVSILSRGSVVRLGVDVSASPRAALHYTHPHVEWQGALPKQEGE